MKFTVQKANLLSAMEIANGAIPARSTDPTMYAFLIHIEGMTGEIMANDLMTGITTKFACMAEEDGEICINAKTLMSAVKKMGKADITFEQDGTQVIVTGGKARYEFALENKDNFTRPKGFFDDSVKFKVDADQFAGMINGVAFCCSTKENNKVITGINILVKSGSLTLSALDLVQVAVRQIPINSDDVNVIVPQKPMLELAKSANGGEIDIEVAKNHICFTFSDTSMIVRLIDGKFLDIQRVMTDDFKTFVRSDRSELMGCLDRSLVVMRDDKKPMVFDVSESGMNVSLKSNVNAFDEDVDCETDGEPMQIGLNPQKLLDILKHIETDEVEMSLISGTTPMTIKNDELGFRYILLPVNI